MKPVSFVKRVQVSYLRGSYNKYIELSNGLNSKVKNIEKELKIIVRRASGRGTLVFN